MAGRIADELWLSVFLIGQLNRHVRAGSLTYNAETRANEPG
jgi:hypothetical protein